MSSALRQRLLDALSSFEIYDPHTHIQALQPASTTLADILGYHYYTELAHSSGLSRERIEEPGLAPREKVGRLVSWLGTIENTIQYSWLVEMAQTFFGFTDERITTRNWEALYDAAEERMRQPQWAARVLSQSRLKGVFLTNDFDDSLQGFDQRIYVPCLRTDDLVFHLHSHPVRERLERSSGIDVTDVRSLRAAIGERFAHFQKNGARACAISLPPDFVPQPVEPSAADAAWTRLLRDSAKADSNDRQTVGRFIFWTLAEYCAEYRWPFDLMIGVNRSVYEQGVHQGRDLYDSRVSLIQYRYLWNAFPQVLFPVSVLASVTNQELTSYAWIFPNVIAHGHWWYSNTPTFIEHDAAARLEAIPGTKQIGYYSDMYKLEFALPKFNMYRRILAKVLSQRFVIDRGWSEERALELGRTILRDNTERIFGLG
jgi:glucuronate isomerase